MVDARRRTQLAVQTVIDGRQKYIIAALAGMPANTLGGIISGRVQPSRQQQERLADVLGVPVADLFGGE